MNVAKRRKGFSIVELIITVALLMIIMVAVSTVSVRVSNASTDQQRRQAFHANEEQVRLALLNFVRDVRTSSGVLPGSNNLSGTNTANDSIVFIATRGASTGTVTYTLRQNNSTDYFVGGRYLLERTLGAGIVLGPGPDDWPNPSSVVAIHDMIVTEVGNRLNIEIVVTMPVTGNEPPPVEVCTLALCCNQQCRVWRIRSSVATQRRPS